MMLIERQHASTCQCLEIRKSLGTCLIRLRYILSVLLFTVCYGFDLLSLQADVHDHIEYGMTSLDMYSAMAENLINYTFNVCPRSLFDCSSAEGPWFQMASYEMNEVMYASELSYCPSCHSTSIQAPLDVVHCSVLASDIAHRILCKLVPFFYRNTIA
jgi:hypothetical protein